MYFHYFLSGGGILSLLFAVVAGIFCGGIYCTAPDVFSYASGEAVRKELMSLPKSTLTVLGCSVYLIVLGVWAAGPAVITIAGLPLYAMTIIFFVAGFAFSSYDNAVPLPEMITGPFLVLAMTHNYPNLVAVGGSAMAIAAVLFMRCLLGLSLVIVLTATGDPYRPRLYGIITDDTWLFMAGAAAWVGVTHMLGLMLCLTPTVIVALICLRFFNARVAAETRAKTVTFALTPEPTPFIIPWGALITLALLMEMVLRHECGGAPLMQILTPYLANSF